MISSTNSKLVWNHSETSLMSITSFNSSQQKLFELLLVCGSDSDSQCVWEFRGAAGEVTLNSCTLSPLEILSLSGKPIGFFILWQNMSCSLTWWQKVLNENAEVITDPKMLLLKRFIFLQNLLPYTHNINIDMNICRYRKVCQFCNKSLIDVFHLFAECTFLSLVQSLNEWMYFLLTQRVTVILQD